MDLSPFHFNPQQQRPPPPPLSNVVLSAARSARAFHPLPQTTFYPSYFYPQAEQRRPFANPPQPSFLNDSNQQVSFSVGPSVESSFRQHSTIPSNISHFQQPSHSSIARQPRPPPSNPKVPTIFHALSSTSFCSDDRLVPPSKGRTLPRRAARRNPPANRKQVMTQSKVGVTDRVAVAPPLNLMPASDSYQLVSKRDAAVAHPEEIRDRELTKKSNPITTELQHLAEKESGLVIEGDTENDSRNLPNSFDTFGSGGENVRRRSVADGVECEEQVWVAQCHTNDFPDSTVSLPEESISSCHERNNINEGEEDEIAKAGKPNTIESHKAGLMKQTSAHIIPSSSAVSSNLSPSLSSPEDSEATTIETIMNRHSDEISSVSDDDDGSSLSIITLSNSIREFWSSKFNLREEQGSHILSARLSSLDLSPSSSTLTELIDQFLPFFRLSVLQHQMSVTFPLACELFLMSSQIEASSFKSLMVSDLHASSLVLYYAMKYSIVMFSSRLPLLN